MDENRLLLHSNDAMSLKTNTEVFATGHIEAPNNRKIVIRVHQCDIISKETEPEVRMHTCASIVVTIVSL